MKTNKKHYTLETFIKEIQAARHRDPDLPTGVHPHNEKYRAQISFKRKQHHLGTFPTVHGAYRLRQAAEKARDNGTFKSFMRPDKRMYRQTKSTSFRNFPSTAAHLISELDRLKRLHAPDYVGLTARTPSEAVAAADVNGNAAATSRLDAESNLHEPEEPAQRLPVTIKAEPIPSKIFVGAHLPHSKQLLPWHGVSLKRLSS